jgi:hypothetical protein
MPEMTITPSEEERVTRFERPVSLSIPVDGFVDVARLVVGGAASQFPLGFEAIDDIQLAVETILRAGLIDGDRATLELISDDGALTITIEPVIPAAVDRPIVDSDRATIDPLALLRQLVDSAEARPEPTPALMLKKTFAPGA